MLCHLSQIKKTTNSANLYWCLISVCLLLMVILMKNKDRGNKNCVPSKKSKTCELLKSQQFN